MSNYVVALTGGIGSGKSTVADLFAKKGIKVIDADIVARQVVEPGTPGLEAIKQKFGDQIIAENGRLDRASLRKRVFAHSSDREWLNQLLHPIIGQEMQKQLLAASSQYSLWVVPLLIENRLYQKADRVLVVDLPTQAQLERAASRDGADIAQIEKIIKAQATRQQRLDKADDVIDNTGTATHLAPQVDKLHQLYMELSKQA